MCKPTPTLRRKEAADFLLKILRKEDQKVGLVPTPKLENAVKLIKELAEKRHATTRTETNPRTDKSTLGER